MKNLMYPMMTALLITVSAHAQVPENNASGGGVFEAGFDPCEVCASNKSSLPIQASKSYESLMPDAGPSAPVDEETKAAGTK